MTNVSEVRGAISAPRWRELWLKEDWWAIWLGLGIVIIGYAFRPKSDATLEVGSASFALATKQDGAWIKNQAEETDLVAAMRVSQSAVLKGESAKGTRSTDRFALNGLTEALDRSEQDCK